MCWSSAKLILRAQDGWRPFSNMGGGGSKSTDNTVAGTIYKSSKLSRDFTIIKLSKDPNMEATTEATFEVANEAKNAITSDRVTARADSQTDVKADRAIGTEVRAKENTEEATRKDNRSKPHYKRETRWLRKRKREEELPPEKKGSWTRKEQRQGEADKPGPGSEEVDSDGDCIPSLIEEEDSDEECSVADSEEDDSEYEYSKQAARLKREMAETEIQDREKKRKPEEKQAIQGSPTYQPPQACTNANYTPGGRRGRYGKEHNKNKSVAISQSCQIIVQRWPRKCRR